MASAEAASSLSSGPHYAPEDPTLPKPWKGLIDGRTGTLYYWNPEANVTQYDRPISLNPPLPPGPPPTASIPKMVPIPVSGTLSSNDSLLQPQESAGQQLPIQNSQQLPYHQSQSVVNQQMPVQNSHQLPYQHSLSIANQQMPVQNAQQLPYHQSHSVINQQMQQQYPQLQLQMSQYPQVSYLQGQLTGLSQIPYQQPQQQGSQFSYQQQPQRSQQSQQPQQPQQLQQQQGSQASFQQQQKRQGSIGPYQQQQQLQVSNIPFQMGQQQLQGSGASHQQGQQQPESKQTDAYQQVKQPQGQQIGGVVFDYLKQQPESKQTDAYQQVKQPQGQQIGVLRMESEQQDASLMPSNRPLSGVATQAQVSKMGFGSVKEQQQQFGGPASAKKPLGGLPSEFTGPSSGGQQFNETSSGGQKISGPSFQNDACFRQEKIKGFNQEGQPMVRSMGIQLGNEEGQRERSGNQFTSFNRNEILMLPARQPKLASLPRCQEWKLQGMQSGDVKAHFVSSGQSSGLNMPPGNAVTNFYDHPPFPTAAPMRPPQRMFGASEFTNSTPVDAYRQHHEITARGDNIPAPFMTFEATGFPPEILREMHLAGFTSPTPIQAQTWPVALQSRDIVAIAKTGSGKTLGYLVPAFIHLRRSPSYAQFGPSVLVLAPTRELATQIQDEAIKFGRSSRVSCICLYGGAPKGPQLRDIERGSDIVVATPGRLNDILDMKKINLHHVSFLVLDEADRMLDMGFEPQIRKIVNEIPRCRQTLMYTATWPKEVRKIAGDLLANPVQVNIGSIDELAANKSITQYVEVIPPMDKQRRLEQILRSQQRGTKIIVFCSTKRLCDQLARSIGRPFGAASIHGDKSQDERDYVLNQFRCGKAPILVATDVAARGIDVKDIRVVINYDFPTTIEDYVHRIGRTGRAGATGVSYTFLSEQDWKYAGDLIKVLEGANQSVPPEVREMAARGGPLFSRNYSHGGMGRFESGRSSNGGRGGGRWDSGSGRRESGGDCGSGIRDFGGGHGGGRNDIYGGRGSLRGRGFGGSQRWGRHDRYYNNHPDERGRLDGGSSRGYIERARGRSYSRSRSQSWSRSRSPSQSWSRSRSRSWSRGRSRSRSKSRSRSRSPSYERYEKPRRRRTLFSDGPGLPGDEGSEAFRVEAPPVAGTNDIPIGCQLLTKSPGQDNGSLPGNNITTEAHIAEQSLAFASPESVPELGQQQPQGEGGGGGGGEL